MIDSWRPGPVAIIGLIGMSVMGAVASLLSGAFPLSANDVLTSVFRDSAEPVIDTIVTIRLVRIVAAISVGASLALSGLLLQSLTRNVLAEPGLLGISAGAGFAVVAMSTVFGAELTLSTSTIAALTGAAVSGLFAFGLAGGFTSGGANRIRLILSGAVLSLLLTALTTILLSLDTNTLDDTRVWLAGSLADRPAETVLPLSGLVAIAVGMTWLLSGRLTVLSLGETAAIGLGVDPVRTRIISLSLALFFAGLAVAIAGPIAFVGLMAPHLARWSVGSQLSICVPASTLIGASVLLFSDSMVRELAPPAEAPVGVAILLLGAPFFLLILRRAL